jgi:tRNA dimethylallyltransferase
LLRLEGFEDSNAARSVGYKEVILALRGDLERAQLLPKVQQATRQLAKRQMTWFRREPDVHWLRPRYGKLPVEQAELLLLQWLADKQLREPANQSGG